MGRKKKRVELTAAQRAELQRRLALVANDRDHERLQTLLRAITGRHGLEDLARLAGRARSTIQLWLNKFASAGIKGLLERHTPPGSTSPVGAVGVQDQLKEGLRTGRWRSASEVAEWLNEAHGIKRDGLYVMVPPGKQFYVYVTQTIDRTQARPGLSRFQSPHNGLPSPPNSGPSSPHPSLSIMPQSINSIAPFTLPTASTEPSNSNSP
ncbi:MAG: helix-turn-helix domain-containing protein [Candidatus Omnitrophica bacterium]|nr:helix-turn-helix domain-containing protein [Candidatus Omnitrophota bacterium]